MSLRALHQFLPDDFGLPPTLALLSVIAASLVIGIFFQWMRQRDARMIAKINNAVKLLHDFTSSSATQTLYQSYAAVENHPDGACGLLDEGSSFATEHRRNIISLLSHYEFVAIAVFRKALDERFCRDLYGENLVQRFDVMKPYITAVREGRGGVFRGKKRATVYKWFEKLAEKWRRQLKVRR